MPGTSTHKVWQLATPMVATRMTMPASLVSIFDMSGRLGGRRLLGVGPAAQQHPAHLFGERARDAVLEGDHQTLAAAEVVEDGGVRDADVPRDVLEPDGLGTALAQPALGGVQDLPSGLGRGAARADGPAGSTSPGSGRHQELPRKRTPRSLQHCQLTELTVL